MHNLLRSPLIAIMQAEILFNLKRVAPWIMIALFGFNAVLWSWGGIAQQYGWAINSDFFIARLCGGFTFLTSPFFVAMLMGDPVIRDFRYQIDPLLLAAPVRRIEYLLGKFLGNFLVLTLCSASLMLAAFLLQLVPPPENILLPLRVTPYLKHFLIIVVISHLALGALCFAVGTLTRSVKLVYSLIPALYILAIALSIGDELYSRRWFRMVNLNPLMFGAANATVWNLRAAQVNQLMIKYGFDLIINRTLMIVLAAVCLTIVWSRFARAGRSASRERSASSINTLGLMTLTELPYSSSTPLEFDPVTTSEQTQAATERQTAAISRVSISISGWYLRFTQFSAAVNAEFRLLRAERSLIILVPLVIFLSSLEFNSFSNVFGALFFPLSSIYAPNSVRSLLILLGGLTIFYTGEVMHRDRELGVEPALWSTPVPDWVLLLSKFAAMFLLACSLMTLTALTAIALQLYRGAIPEITPYLIIYSVILLPSVALMIGAAMTLNVILRNKYLAHAVGTSLGGGLFYLFGQGYTNWLYNPVLYQLWTYSDLTGLEPYRTGLALHRVYWLAITVVGLALAQRFFKRSPATGRRGAMTVALAAALIAVVVGFIINREINRGLERSSLEAARIRYEERFSQTYREAPQPEWSRVDLQVELHPAEHRLHARGTFKLENRSGQEITSVLVSLDPAYHWQTLTIDGASHPPQLDELARLYTLDTPLQPSGATVLRAEWDATIPQGLLRSSGVYTNFIMEGGTLLGGPDFVEWLPRIGYLRKWEITDTSIRRRYGKGPLQPLPDLKDARFIPAGSGGFPVAPFDLHLEIAVPKAHTAVSAGRLLEVREQGERHTFVYESDHPVNGFPIVSAPYAKKQRGNFAVYYHPRHAFNVDTLLDAMEASRQKYERDYGPLPYRDLRFVEFPRLADFAISYPSTIPCAESLVFLTREDEAHVNSNYFAAAHEIAHQWFGSMVVAGRSAGSSVLLEGLAEYAAGALMDEKLGKQATRIFRRHEEATYLRYRQADHEVPLISVDGSHPSHGVIFYQKAGLVFHMLETLIGREKMNAALKEYIARFSARAAHPTIHDLIAIFKRQTPEGAFDWFYEQWFYRVTMPDFQIASAKLRQAGNEYVIEFKASNLGSGQMLVTVEAITGDEREAASFHSTSVQIKVAQGQETKGVIRCSFKPERLMLDRMHEVIDTERRNNEYRF